MVNECSLKQIKVFSKSKSLQNKTNGCDNVLN